MRRCGKDETIPKSSQVTTIFEYFWWMINDDYIGSIRTIPNNSRFVAGLALQALTRSPQFAQSWRRALGSWQSWNLRGWGRRNLMIFQWLSIDCSGKFHWISMGVLQLPLSFHWISRFPLSFHWMTCQDWGVGGFAGKSHGLSGAVLGLPIGSTYIWRFASSLGWWWFHGGELAPGSICWQTCGEGWAPANGGWEVDGIPPMKWSRIASDSFCKTQVIGRGLGMLRFASIPSQLIGTTHCPIPYVYT